MDRIEIGIIGAGWWAATNHIPALLRNPHVSTVAINRPDKDNLDKLGRAFNLSHAFTDTAAMLDQRPLKGVVIASPHFLHAEHAALCIERNLPMLIEKPMTTSTADARDLVARAARKGLEILVPYGWNFKPYSEVAYEWMRQGWIGEVRHAVCQMASPLQDLFEGNGLAGTESNIFRPATSTWADPARAGGYGWGQLSHVLGLFFLLVEHGPQRVFAVAGRSSAEVDQYDAAVIQLDNGATISLSGSATVPKIRGYQMDIRIFGSDGMLLLDIERERLELVRNNGETLVHPMSPGAGAYTCEEPVDRFVDICRGQTVFNPGSGLVGMRAVEVLDAMYRSSQSGRMEEV